MSFLGPIQWGCSVYSVFCLTGISGLQRSMCLKTLPCHAGCLFFFFFIKFEKEKALKLTPIPSYFFISLYDIFENNLFNQILESDTCEIFALQWVSLTNVLFHIMLFLWTQYIKPKGSYSGILLQLSLKFIFLDRVTNSIIQIFEAITRRGIL